MHPEKITLSQLEQYLSKAAWILKGPVDASDFKVYIFPLLFFKRISDVYDEEYQLALDESDGDIEYATLPEFHRFEIPEGCHWKDVRETTANVGLAIEQALRGIEQANQAFLYGIFGDAQWSNKNKLSDRLLIDLIEHFSQYQLSNSRVSLRPTPSIFRFFWFGYLPSKQRYGKKVFQFREDGFVSGLCLFRPTVVRICTHLRGIGYHASELATCCAGG